MEQSKSRETFGSRLGFLLLSAGCAIGLGNVWRFPYVTGEYGGGAFVLFYLAFLALLGIPIMVMEFSVGRASKKSVAASFTVLEKKGSKWHLFSYVAIAGNYLLMMFYTTIGGWMMFYFFKTLSGGFEGLDSSQVTAVFGSMTSDPFTCVFWMLIAVFLGFFVCALGLDGGMERITKIMMLLLLALMGILLIRSVTLPGGLEGLSFFLVPDFSRMAEAGTAQAIFAAMGQAFFTLSIGIGSMAIFGSYLNRERSLMGEAVNVAVLDTIVALIAGAIIFPACFAYDINPGSGPELVFVTLSNVFAAMPGGRFWGSIFFLFLSFAALSTIIAVFENIVSIGMDLRGWSRKKSVAVNLVLICILSLPVALGFNLLSFIQPLGAGTTILDLEDFIVSNNLLPLGALVYVLFCTCRYGWGFECFLGEANQGKGLKFPRWARVYVSYILPVLVLFVFVQGYIGKFL